METDAVIYFLDWLSVNMPAAVFVLIALLPVMSVAVAGYAVHVLGARGKRKK